MKDRTGSEHWTGGKGGGSDIRPIAPPPYFCPDVNWKGSYGSAAKGSRTSVLNGPVIASLAAWSRYPPGKGRGGGPKKKKEINKGEEKMPYPGWVENLVVRLIGGT
ncbi:hypothetical protein TNCV_4247421 [Trichonephila clavipes]|nr:hypothetical protein TNCV_4247421 [Trichonephila clavipes]